MISYFRHLCTGYSPNWRKLKTLIYCKYNESFIKQGQDAPLSNSNFLLEIRLPGNLDGDFAPHSLELVSINRFLMAYYLSRRSFPLYLQSSHSRKGNTILWKENDIKKQEKELTVLWPLKVVLRNIFLYIH